LPQQHRGPVLGFRTAGAGLDIQEAVHRIGRVREHAAELEALEFFLKAVGVALDGFQRGVVIIGGSQFEKLLRIGDAAVQRAQRFDDVFEGFFLAPQILGVFGVIPDSGVFEFCVDDLQAFGLQIVVKDTPVTPARALRSRRGGRRVGSDVRLPW